MPLRGFKVTAVTSAALAAFMTVTGGPALASRAQSAETIAPAGGSHRVLLITGDVVTVSDLPGGRQAASVTRAHPDGPGGRFQTFNQGRNLYVVPQSAVPYLGSTLSLSLFDVTALARQEQGALSLTVRMRLRTSPGRGAVPGITLGRRSGRNVTGRLTETSARRFGAALAAQAERDHASPVHDTGLFAVVAHIGPDAAALPRARPDFPMYTLTLNGIDAAGARDTGDVVSVANVDNLRKYIGFQLFYKGRAKVSVPDGHYVAFCYFYDFSTGAVAEVTLPQFTVAGNTSVTLDARDATAPVSVSTPRPAHPVLKAITVGRSDRLGGVVSSTFLGSGQAAFTVNPVTRRVSVGQLYYYVYWELLSPAGAKSPYSYDAEFPSTGEIPADQHYAAQPGGLAAVRSSYPATRAGQDAMQTRFSLLPWQVFTFSSGVPVTTPLRRTEYYTARPDLVWEADYDSVFRPSSFTMLGELDSSWRTYQPGESYATTWGGQPQHPRLLQTDLYPGAVYCPACISGSRLDLLAFPFSDNSPEHRGYPDGSTKGVSESESYEVYAGEVPVAHGTGLLQKAVTLPTGTRDVRINYDTTRSSSDFTLSTSVATQWTVRTAAPTAPLPAGWYCDLRNRINCAVLPLMTADYHLPVNMLGQLPPGPVTATIDVSHLAASAAVAVRSLRVAVSFNGGASWRKATLTREGAGLYAMSFSVPPAARTNGFGALRLRGADVYGGTLSQTIQHAFAVAAP